MTSWVRLSSARPKNAFQSPRRRPAPSGARRSPIRRSWLVGGRAARRIRRASVRTRAASASHQASWPVARRHVGVRRSRSPPGPRAATQPLGEAQPHAVALALTRARRVDESLDAEVLPLGVRRHEVPEPPARLPRNRRPRTCGRPPSALVIAARHALLAPFLVDQRRLAALLAEIADRPGAARAPPAPPAGVPSARCAPRAPARARPAARAPSRARSRSADRRRSARAG